MAIGDWRLALVGIGRSFECTCTKHPGGILYGGWNVIIGTITYSIVNQKYTIAQRQVLDNSFRFAYSAGALHSIKTSFVCAAATPAS
jgi:hypothetical protein